MREINYMMKLQGPEYYRIYGSRDFYDPGAREPIKMAIEKAYTPETITMEDIIPLFDFSIMRRFNTDFMKYWPGVLFGEDAPWRFVSVTVCHNALKLEFRNPEAIAENMRPPVTEEDYHRDLLPEIIPISLRLEDLEGRYPDFEICFRFDTQKDISSVSSTMVCMSNINCGIHIIEPIFNGKRIITMDDSSSYVSVIERTC